MSEKTLCAQIYRAVHNAGGCGATSEYDRGYDDGVSAALEAITALTGVDESCLDEDNDDGTVVVPGRWIPVEERLPEDMQETLCCFDDGFIATATYMVKYKDWELWQDAGEVTHWMPLPEPPTV